MLLEHRHGYTFLRSGLVQESLTYWQLDPGPTPKGFHDYLAWLINEDSITFLPRAVSLHARWEGNFWHLHDNVLSKLIAIDELDLPDDVPLLVGRSLWEKSSLPGAADDRAFRDRNWVLHDRPIRTDRMIVCLEGSFRRENMAFVHQSLADTRFRSRHRRRHRSSSSSSAKRVSNGTSTTSPRSRNSLAPRGFTTLRAERLSLPERLQTFRAARCVVLPIGAGLANVVHRIGRPTGIVEVFPADKEFAQPYGAWLSPGVRLRVPGGGGEHP